MIPQKISRHNSEENLDKNTSLEGSLLSKDGNNIGSGSEHCFRIRMKMRDDSIIIRFIQRRMGITLTWAYLMPWA